MGSDVVNGDLTGVLELVAQGEALSAELAAPPGEAEEP